jgi:hypothetical protein
MTVYGVLRVSRSLTGVQVRSWTWMTQGPLWSVLTWW